MLTGWQPTLHLFILSSPITAPKQPLPLFLIVLGALLAAAAVFLPAPGAAPDKPSE